MELVAFICIDFKAINDCKQRHSLNQWLEISKAANAALKSVGQPVTLRTQNAVLKRTHELTTKGKEWI